MPEVSLDRANTMCSGVSPLLFRAFGSAPASSSSAMPGFSPDRAAAKYSGVDPCFQRIEQDIVRVSAAWANISFADHQHISYPMHGEGVRGGWTARKRKRKLLVNCSSSHEPGSPACVSRSEPEQGASSWKRWSKLSGPRKTSCVRI